MAKVEEVLCSVLKVERMNIETFRTIQFHIELEGIRYLVSFANMDSKDADGWELSALSSTIVEYIKTLNGKEIILNARALLPAVTGSETKQ